MYDVIIVGARCGGSPTAMLLARRGHRVLMVDRARFPSDTLSTHFIQQPGAALLARWGLLSRLEEAGTPPVQKATFATVEGGEGFEIPPVPGIQGPIAPRRTLLDKVLVDAAVDAGAEVREGFTFEDLITEDGRVTGIVGRNADGDRVNEKAKIVVGADGRHSKVAELVGSKKYEDIPPLGCGYYSYWRDLEPNGVELYLESHMTLIGFPTNDDLVLTATLFEVERFDEVRRDPKKFFTNAVKESPVFADRARNATVAEKIRGSADIPNFMREPAGPGWALVGDAGYHKDPTPADGITDAFTAADLLVETIDSVLSGNADENEAFAEYKQRRDEAARPHFDLCLKASTFGTPPEERIAAFTENVTIRFTEALEIAAATEAQEAAV